MEPCCFGDLGAPDWFVFEGVDAVGEIVAGDLGGCYVCWLRTVSVKGLFE